ncbi:hypothetical protein [Georgenia yuyongxinii]|uniref:Uncharacterized protein n=1 Tax=Georgenia yuyongxinii TaxID=2589797 RepID=A0A552WVH4_9MICO|nr:hypothetical protein [Georgenia yuyongxinii]TRW46283.1 hypothetical protein FJ693_05965 [Georgenia yuyongxinii]
MEKKEQKPGAADLTFGGAEDAIDTAADLVPSPSVHGDEGGGDPAASAHRDSAPGEVTARAKHRRGGRG